MPTDVPTQTNHAADLAAVGLVDAIPRILEVVCRTTGMGFSAVARVTEDRWIACAVHDEIAFGLEPGGELEIKSTLCNEVRASGTMVVIGHVSEDETYRGHHTPARYGFESYISVPIYRPGGEFFGTLCAIDPRPARLNTPEIIDMFKLFADLIGFHLEAHDRIDHSERALLDERRHSQLREQFIAVLGHDLRNPLSAIQAGGKLLAMMPLDEKGHRVASIIQSSSARMAALIENVLDLARGQVGGGVPINHQRVADLDVTLEQVVTELRTASPGREVRTSFALSRPVTCDRARVAQLFSNLLANALTHGDSGRPVTVTARSADDGFELAVSNAGPPIPPELMDRLFLPFERASARPGQQGLGLGLYIASEIARGHGGTLNVSSSAEETRFVFQLRS